MPIHNTKFDEVICEIFYLSAGREALSTADGRFKKLRFVESHFSWLFSTIGIPDSKNYATFQLRDQRRRKITYISKEELVIGSIFSILVWQLALHRFIGYLEILALIDRISFENPNLKLSHQINLFWKWSNWLKRGKVVYFETNLRCGKFMYYKCWFRPWTCIVTFNNNYYI